MKHFIFILGRPSRFKGGGNIFTFLFPSGFKFSYCSMHGFELEVKMHLGLMTQPLCSTSLALSTRAFNVFCETYQWSFPELTHSRLEAFHTRLLAGSGYFQSWVQPRSVSELENYFFWLNRVVYLNKVRWLQSREDTKGWEEWACLGDQGAGMKGSQMQETALPNLHLPNWASLLPGKYFNHHK